jgi:hypothetical protein
VRRDAYSLVRQPLEVETSREIDMTERTGGRVKLDLKELVYEGELD